LPGKAGQARGTYWILGGNFLFLLETQEFV
jgi:tetratricopeptide (TPR) repeat protein